MLNIFYVARLTHPLVQCNVARTNQASSTEISMLNGKKMFFGYIAAIRCDDGITEKRPFKKIINRNFLIRQKSQETITFEARYHVDM